MPDCVCDLYGPHNCGCIAGRLNQQVARLGLSPQGAAEMLDALAALYPGEVKRHRYCGEDCGGNHVHVGLRRIP